jgi:AcrR family transcriptional regulator
VEGEGLRERNKAKRRAAITRAAYQLFADRGYQATTITDIAAAAEVSPRTVATYFPSKQDIALHRFSESVDELTGALRRRRAGETVTEIIGRWLRTNKHLPDQDIRTLGRRMFEANPDLRALRTARMAQAVRQGAEAIAQDTGTTPCAAGPRIAAAATAAILIELADITPGPEGEHAITTALRFLEAGIRSL